MLGRQIAVLVNEFKQAGRYSFSFNAAALSSGIYFYKLQSGNASVTKKMILSK
ncbi:MAG TPA: T9SS type A sorting domain-containing protein [Ignavibacteria bacterium]|nr:T9SS type A sorting domain-containing protein [Ignavibacteria bacterium]